MKNFFSSTRWLATTVMRECCYTAQLPFLSCAKNPGKALYIPQLRCCSIAASLSSLKFFQGEIAMLELIWECRTKSCSVASYWLSVRKDSAPSSLTTKSTKHDPFTLNGRPIYASALSSCLSLPFLKKTVESVWVIISEFFWVALLNDTSANDKLYAV